MSSDGPVDLEKGATEVKMAATEEVKGPRMSMAHMVFVDAVAVLQVLLFIGATIYMVSVSHTWWSPLAAVTMLLLLLVFGLWLKPKTNYGMEPTPGRDNDDLSNKLLAEK